MPVTIRVKFGFGEGFGKRDVVFGAKLAGAGPSVAFKLETL